MAVLDSRSPNAQFLSSLRRSFRLHQLGPEAAGLVPLSALFGTRKRLSVFLSFVYDEK